MSLKSSILPIAMKVGSKDAGFRRKLRNTRIKRQNLLAGVVDSKMLLFYPLKSDNANITSRDGYTVIHMCGTVVQSTNVLNESLITCINTMIVPVLPVHRSTCTCTQHVLIFTSVSIFLS